MCLYLSLCLSFPKASQHSQASCRTRLRIKWTPCTHPASKTAQPSVSGESSFGSCSHIDISCGRSALCSSLQGLEVSANREGHEVLAIERAIPQLRQHMPPRLKPFRRPCIRVLNEWHGAIMQGVNIDTSTCYSGLYSTRNRQSGEPEI